MQKRPYGNLGYEVSALGMGCMRLPRVAREDGKVSVDLEAAFELIRYAADNGITYFDTAFTYHAMQSEAVLGEALEGGRRDKVKIATKQPFGVMKTQADIRKNLESALKKLRTDHIDVYLIHNIQEATWPQIKAREVIAEYQKFRDEGLIGAIGFSYHGEYPTFAEILNHFDWDMCQIQQNVLDVDHEATSKAMEDAGKKGTALVIMEPLRGGGLASPPPQNVRALYDEFDKDRAPAEWAFRHLLDSPAVSTILSGMTTMEQLKENIAIFSKPDAVAGCLSAQEKDILARAKAAYEAHVNVPCTACEYCMPCPSGVNIPGVFARYNEGMMFGNFDQPRRSYMFMERSGSSAAACVECGACEAQCPQHIAIIEQLKTAREKLEGWKE
jgi:predicted aldo/keto reductase-like oxidoreductase